MKRIGIYGGTFDPPHFGHIHCALSLLEAHNLDHVYFIPANTNPHKAGKKTTSSEDRYQMTVCALKNVPHCSALRIDIDRPGPSYMIDTVHLLKKRKRFRECALFLLMGEDLLDDLCRWKEYEEVLRLSPPLIATRSNEMRGSWQKDTTVQETIVSGLTATKCIDISATEIRARYAAHLYCEHLVPRLVNRYIEQHKLYGVK